MKRLHRLLPIALPCLLLCAAPGARAAGGDSGYVAPPPATYRIVSPDGHVTYSDRQPTDPKLQTRQLGHAAPVAPLFAPGNQLFDPPRMGASSTALAAGRSGDGPTPPMSASGKPFPPGVPDAVLSVVGHQFFVQTMVETCTRAGQGSQDRYQIIVRNWRDRNSDILSHSNQLMFRLFTGEQRDLLRATARSRLQALLAPPDASAAEKASWCERSAEDLLRRRLELVGNERLLPLVNTSPD